MTSPFHVAPDHYDRFMGRYSERLAPVLCDAAGVEPGMRALDVGCGPGSLTSELVRRLGAENVAAADPSPPFVDACRERYPGVDVRLAPAEELPFADATFDTSLASLVVQFMSDPLAGVGEMARVTTPGGTVAACVWDQSDDGMEMLVTFWRAARAVGGVAPAEGGRPGTQAGELGELLRRAGLVDVEEFRIATEREYASFDDLWEPFTFGVGPAGAYVSSLDDGRREALRDALRAELGNPQGSFTLVARANFARGARA